MHEVKISLPQTHVGEAAKLAHSVGIEQVSVSDIFIDGPNLPAKVLSVETSTPKARAFIESFWLLKSLRTLNRRSRRASFAPY